MQSIPPDLARSALDAAPDAMIIIDSAGIIRYANRQVTALFGYQRDDIIGREVELLMPQRYRIRHLGHRERYEHGGKIRPMGVGLELFGRRLDGREFPVEISLSPIDDGARTLTAAAIRDVSDRKRVEAELIVARESAEQALAAADRARHAADRERQLADRARDSADRANQAKSRFLATASHDLRQPLQTLALLNGTLRRIDTDPDSAGALLQQEQAIGAMSRLLNTLLDMSKLESGAVKPEPADFAISTLFEELGREFGSVATNKGIQLQVDKPGDCVRSDPALVEQILRNLVSNAVKYTHAGTVRLRAARARSTVQIEVSDTGVGIPADQLHLIYDEFYQVGISANSAREGYGLGLSIVQRLVNLLGLELIVESEVGKGSKFTLTLPASRQGAQQPVPGETQAPAKLNEQPGRCRVLLVEDDLAVRDATRLLLKVEGYQVTAVACLTEAMRAARAAEGVDLLVTDYHLQDGETGTQVIAAVREALQAPVKAILITGDTSNAIKELPRDPSLRIASKPIRAEELLTLIRGLLAT